MKLNIKNARRLETSIDEQISRMAGKINSSVEYSSAQESITSTIESIARNLEAMDTYQILRMYIRNAIGIFNQEKGINDITSDIAYLSHRLEVVTTISEMRSPRRSRGYGSDEIEFSSGLDDKTRESYYAESLKIKRQLQRLKDKCQGINSSGTIEFTAEQESFLKVKGLLD